MNRIKSIIKLEDIVFSYPGSDTRVLNKVNLELYPGERIGLMAPNGSGKTTLFHTIMGLCKPQSGQINLFGESVKSQKEFARARSRIGLLFQDSDDQLFCPTVLEDIAFGPLNLGFSRKQALTIAMDMLENLGIKNLEHKITHRLSGGQKRLVALAAVLAMKPEVLLLDEPTTALDMDVKAKLINILNGLDISLIAISHEFDFISKVTDKVFSMEDGKILTDDEVHVHQHEHVHKHGRHPHVHK